jgi:hypothetical protein
VVFIEVGVMASNLPLHSGVIRGVSHQVRDLHHHGANIPISLVLDYQTLP